MKYLGAYLLAVLGGDPNVSVAKVTAILASVGIESDPERAEQLVAALRGQDLDRLIKEGVSRLAQPPCLLAPQPEATTAEKNRSASCAETAAAAPPAADEESEPEDVGNIFDWSSSSDSDSD